MLPRLIQQLEKRFGGRLADLVRPKPIITASSLQRGHLDEVCTWVEGGDAPINKTHSSNTSILPPPSDSYLAIERVACT